MPYIGGMRDPYDVLGLNKNASQTDIKKAFRTLAKKYHPDAAGNGPAAKRRFQEVSAAYEILGDAKKRADYDAGRIDREGHPRAEEPPFSWRGRASGGAEGFNPEDVFSDLFGGGSRFSGFGFGGGKQGRMGARAGQDYQMSMAASFREAAIGGTRRIRLADGAELDVRIPVGIRDGQQIRIKGRGGPGLYGGPPGDVLIEVKVEADPRFLRDGNDIKQDLPISLKESVLGAKVDVETLTGAVRLSVPAGSNSGTTLRLKGKGIPAHDGEAAGDLYVRLIVTLPTTPDGELTRFVERWRTEYDPRGQD